MATRLAWWTIPATVVVMVRVVTMPPPAVQPAVPPAVPPAVAPEPADPAVPAPPAPMAEGKANFDIVMLRDAAGTRFGPIGVSIDGALSLRLPVASRRVDFVLRRYLGREAAPSLWSQGAPRVRADGTMSILGLPAGRYAIEITWAENGETHRVARDDITVPGTFDLRQ